MTAPTGAWTRGARGRAASTVLLSALLASLLLVRVSGAATPSGSIAELVARANPGDTVVVPPGVYREQLVVDRRVTLVGNGEAVIDGGGRGDVVRVVAADVTLRGFTIRGSGRDVVAEPAAIRILADRATVEDNRIQDTLYGIVMEDSEGHRILRNQISSMVEFGAERRGHALYLWHADRTVVEGNTVRGAKDGVFLGFASHNRVEHNHVSDVRYGIHYMYADHNEFVGNVFRDGVAGGAIMFSRDVTFRGNEFSYNRSAASGYGLLFKDVDDVLMEDNRVHHNRLGITLEGAPLAPGATVTLRRNLVSFNDVAIEVSTTTAATLTENTFTGNLQQVVTTGRGAGRNAWSQDGRGNYWDDYQGYDADGDGVGDIPFQYDGIFEELTRRDEWIRAYAFTPARMALDLAARWFPAFRPEPSVVDRHPLVRPPMRLETTSSPAGRVTATLTMALLLAVPLVGWRWSARGGARW